MGWRDEVPQHVQDDLDELLDRALSAAEKMLVDPVWPPFAVVTSDDDAPSVRAAEGEDAATVLEHLRTGLRADREGLRAASVAYLVEAERGDAVLVELEHAEPGSPALLVSAEVKVERRGGAPRRSLGRLLAGEGSHHVWG